MKLNQRPTAFTLIELIVVIGIIAILIGLVLPAMNRARRQSKTTLCSTRLRTLGQGISIYSYENDDVLPPGRMPKIDEEHWHIEIAGGLKYRPTFLAILGASMGIPAFGDPQRRGDTLDRDGEPGDRQNYENEAYICPETLTWTDERNGCYGYNYQFLGNARLVDEADRFSFKNWPVQYSRIKGPSQTVAVGDCMGTAAGYPGYQRAGYENNGRSLNAMGNEGFNLDPPIVDPVDGEMAGHTGDLIDTGDPGGDQGIRGGGGTSGGGKFKPAEDGEGSRSALDPRHAGKANVLWLDGRVSVETLEAVGYVVHDDKSVDIGDIGSDGQNAGENPTGDNRFWTGNQKNRVWLQR